MKKYNHQKIERKWQTKWEESGLYNRDAVGDEKKPKYYVLDMFPYPSGDGLHMGHTESYTASDIIYRYKRLQGFDVLHPQGFDSFGLPAENYAVKTGVHPKETTKKNTDNYIKQMKMLGLGHDLDHLIYTSDPSYYKWTQWLFGQFFENNLVEQKTDKINWCPSCNTGIANEQVENGKCERCKTEIQQKDVPGWFFKITDFAEGLINDLDKVDWPEHTKKNQRNWIGKSVGAKLKFPVKSQKSKVKSQIEVFTTRPDTLFGATYLVLAPEHPLIENWKLKIENWNEVADYVERAKNKTEMDRLEAKEKTGVKLEGVTAINPANSEEIPIFVADYVLGGYGTGAIMAVPAHDERDFEFATNYNSNLSQKNAERMRKDRGIDAEKQIDLGQFGKHNKIETKKKGAYILLQNSEGKYLLPYSNTKKVYWLPGGRVENGEGEIEALKREIKEETGYTDFKIGTQKITAVYNNVDSSGSKQELSMAIYNGRLLSDNKKDKELTELEVAHDWSTEWVTKEEFLEKVQTMKDKDRAELLSRVIKTVDELETDNKTELKPIEIRQVIAPHFIDSNNPPRPASEGKKLVPRRAVQVVVKHWSEDKVLNLHWKKFPWKTFIIGGVKKGETPEEAAVRELKEETGYKNIKSIKPIVGEFHSEFFAAHKDVNRYAYMQGFYVELEDGKQDEVAQEEHEIFDLVWTDTDKVRDKLTSDDIKAMWDNLQNGAEVYTGSGKLINSGEFDGMDSEEAKKAITEFVGGEMTTNYRLRDWSISRQRYWGCPIPIVYSPEGEAKFVGEENLPWLLPEDVDFVPDGTAPLAKSKELKERTEKIFGKGWTPEVDTMDTFVDSSWYFLRYPDTENEKEFCSREKLKRWLPVDLYIGGAEHTYMHLLYARFFVKAMHKMGLLKFNEPFMKLRHQGMVLDKDGVKMSKSKGNVVNPNDMVEKFGADATRLNMMFAGPLEEDVMWREESVKGVYRFLEKTWRMFQEQERIDCGGKHKNTPKELPRLLHKTIKGVTEDIEELRFNTAISKLMIFVNEFSKNKKVPQGAMQSFLIMLAPFAPHIAEELWEQVGNKESIFNQQWPKYDPKMIKEDEIELVVQINGKVRDKIKVPADISEEDAKEKALAGERIKKYTEDKEIKKVIFVPGRLINLVV